MQRTCTGNTRASRSSSSALALAAVLLCLAWAPAAAADEYDDLIEAARKRFVARELYEATDLFQQARKLAPTRHEAFRGLGRILRAQGNEEQAFALLRKSLKLAPQDALTHYFLGRLYQVRPLAEYAEDALRHLRRAAGLAPPTQTVQKYNLRVECYMQIGAVEDKRGRHAAATAAFTKAHRLSPTDPRPVDRLASRALRAGRVEEARTWYENLLKINPANKTAKSRLAQIKEKQRVARIELELLQHHVRTGQVLPSDKLKVRGYDSKRRIVDFERVWGVSSGLELVSTDPLVIRAGHKPSQSEYIYLTDRKTSRTVKVEVSVLGKPIKLKLSPDKIGRAPGSPAFLTLTGQDKVGNQFGIDDAEWTIKRGETVAAFSVTRSSPTTYRIEVPRDAALGSYTVIAKLGERRVLGRLDVVRYDQPRDGVAWRLDLDEAQVLARKAGKPILLYLWTVTSPMCVRFENEVLASDAIRRELGHVIPVRLNASNVTSLVTRYKLKAVPGIVLLSSRGLYLDRDQNVIPEAELRKRIAAATAAGRKLDSELADLQAAVKAAPKSYPVQLALAQFCKLHYRNELALTHYYAALAVGGTDEARNRARWPMAILEARARNWRACEKLATDMLATSKDKRQLASAYYYKGLAAYHGRRQRTEAIAAWRAAQKAAPRSRSAKSAGELIRKYK